MLVLCWLIYGNAQPRYGNEEEELDTALDDTGNEINKAASTDGLERVEGWESESG